MIDDDGSSFHGDDMGRCTAQTAVATMYEPEYRRSKENFPRLLDSLFF